MILSQFQTVGRDLFARGLVSSHSGNLSIRLGDNIIITRRDSMLNNLEEHDLIETGISKNSRTTPMASPDLATHRAIYLQTPALAIVHAHPPHAVALSMTENKIMPSVEDFAVLGTVPVVGRNLDAKDQPNTLAQSLKENRVIVLHNHGSFAIGQLLEEAYNFTTALEQSAQVLCLSKSWQVSPIQD
jgi:L-fuculose-phosphate aldolase